MEAVDELQGSGAVGEEFFLQLGSTPTEPRHVRFERYLSFGRVVEEVQRASVVVAHAGAGTVLACIQQGKHPVLVPRQARHGEAIDDHQEPFAAKMGEAGLATVVQDLKELGPAILRVRTMAARSGHVGGSQELIGWLDRFWGELARLPHR